MGVSRRYSFKKVTASPEVAIDEPIALETMKSHLRVTEADDDLEIIEHIETARAKVEKETARFLMDQAIYMYADSFDDIVHIRTGPVTAINSIQYYDSDNSLTTLDSSEYYANLDDTFSTIEPVNSWPSTYDRPKAVIIELQVGYATRTKIPAPLKQSVRLIVKGLYDDEENVDEAVELLLQDFRILTA